MAKAKDLSGQEFGNWTVLERDQNHHRHNMWLCICGCGTEATVNGSDLRNGKTKSCGCLRSKTVTKHGMHNTRFYSIWNNMLGRCRNKNSAFYGGRGISVCDEWLSFNRFKSDLYDDYLRHCEVFGEEDTTLDRMDTDGDYEKDNVRWATRKEQINNRRLNKNNSSGYVGVSWVKSKRKWRARAFFGSEEIHIGMFNTIEEAVEARKTALHKFERGLI